MKNLKRSFAVVSDRPAAPSGREAAERHYTDGNALAAIGDCAGARAAYDRALALSPLHAGARFNRAYALASAGDHDGAIEAYRRLEGLTDTFPWLPLNLGVSLVVLERLDEAAEAFAWAVRLRPEDAVAWGNLGSVLGRLERLPEAIDALSRASELAPDSAVHRINLARALQRANRPMAETIAEEAVLLAPDDPETWRTLGDAKVAFGANAEAIEAYSRRIALDPDGALRDVNNLGLALQAEGHLDEAVDLYEAALTRHPEQEAAWSGLGLVQMHMGRVPEAIAAMRRALDLRPSDEYTHSNLLVNLCYSPDQSGESLRGEAERWAAVHAPAELELPPVHVAPRERLRIGYLSADFHEHPAGRLYEALFPHHDRSRFEIVAYANQTARDAVTDRIEASVDAWTNVKGENDQALAARVRADGIDILVDLLGHTPNHRLKAFARRLAPVQATWLGYFGTTGVPAMDFIVADRHVLPEAHEGHFTERPARMPGCMYAFQPPNLDLPLTPPPMIARGAPTFGCFNNVAKLTPETVALWCEVLRARPDARMVLNRWGFALPRVRERYAALFAANGVDPSRVEFLATKGHEAYLRSYAQVDVMLDSFPYGGGTTTSEALWMGVPVVTLPADRFTGRMTTTILHAVGLPELLPEDPAGYVRLALALASDSARLTEMRRTLRTQLESSPLCDLPAYTRDLESTFDWMWANRRS